MKPKPPKNPLKAARKGSRDAEIEMFSRPLPQHKVHKSKRQYNRQNTKARLKKGEPCHLFFKSTLNLNIYQVYNATN